MSHTYFERNQRSFMRAQRAGGATRYAIAAQHYCRRTPLSPIINTVEPLLFFITINIIDDVHVQIRECHCLHRHSCLRPKSTVLLSPRLFTCYHHTCITQPTPWPETCLPLPDHMPVQQWQRKVRAGKRGSAQAGIFQPSSSTLRT